MINEAIKRGVKSIEKLNVGQSADGAPGRPLEHHDLIMPKFYRNLTKF